MTVSLQNQKTATVEVLTAEVRVLMVGSRQITLSVARQLDWVNVGEIEPFGRVRLDSEDWHGNSSDLYYGGPVIGRNPSNGALVRALARPNKERTPIIETLPGAITVCNTILRNNYRNGDIILEFGGRRILVARSVITPCGQHADIMGVYNKEERCPHWLTNGLDSEIRESIDVWDEVRAPHMTAMSLPLIVLAGLK